MKEKELIDIIDKYGSDTSRWPQDKLEDALELLGKSESIKSLYEQEKLLDQMLDEYKTRSAEDDYILRVINENTETTVGGTGFHLNSPYLAYAAGVIICLLAGYLLGYADSFSSDQQIYQLESVLLLRDIY